MIFKTEDDMTQACSLLGLNDVWMGRAVVSGRDDLKQTDKSYFVTIWEKSVVSGPRALHRYLHEFLDEAGGRGTRCWE